LKLFGNDLQSQLFKTRQLADLSIVKKPIVIWTLVAVVVLTAVLVIAFFPGQQRVSLTLLHYQRWPHGATLKLSNDTKKTITYLTQQGGSPTLFMKKTAGGWTNTSLPIMWESFWDGNRWKSAPVYVFSYSSSEVARSRELKPGRNTEVYVGLEPDGLPMRVGVVCCVPQGPIAQRFGKWVARVKQWCHLKSGLPGEIEVWCSEPLQVSAKPERGERD
jgi:hypothetical protein